VIGKRLVGDTPRDIGREWALRKATQFGDG